LLPARPVAAVSLNTSALRDAFLLSRAYAAASVTLIE
jgi:hypothetical protein